MRSDLILVACVRRWSSFLLPRGSRDSRASAGSPYWYWTQPESGPFVNCHVFGFVTLDEILWHFRRGVTDISFEFRIGSDLLDDDSTNSASFRIPSHVITDLECFRHIGHPDL
jgi:hypothetical protein